MPGLFLSLFGAAFRDYEVDGVASSGQHSVAKADVRAIGPQLDLAFANSALAYHLSGSCRAALVGSLPSFTYNNGTNGVGATLTATANGALPAIDGVSLNVNDNMWFWGGPGPFFQAVYGKYTVTQKGDASHPWILTRTTDCDSPDDMSGCGALVTEGTTWAGVTIVIPQDDITVGVTGISPILAQTSSGVAAETARATAAEAALSSSITAITPSPQNYGQVDAATTDVLPSYTYSNGSAGVGATLTATANGSLPAQDTVTLTAGQKLLVKNEVTAGRKYHGVYTVTQIGNGSAPWVLTRDTAADSASELANLIVRVANGAGSQAKNDYYLPLTAPAISVGFTFLPFLRAN